MKETQQGVQRVVAVRVCSPDECDVERQEGW